MHNKPDQALLDHSFLQGRKARLEGFVTNPYANGNGYLFSSWNKGYYSINEDEEVGSRGLKDNFNPNIRKYRGKI